MRYVIYGAGGIGGVIGGRLHQSGHDVVLIARGAHYEAIRAKGLRLQSADEDVTLDISVVDHPDKLDWREDDGAILAMKSQDAAPALEALAVAAPPSLNVACAQNGVANERSAVRFFGNVYGICVMCPTNHLEPGIVQAYSAPVSGILDVGRYTDGVDDVAHEIAKSLSSSTFVSEPRPDIMRWKYGKLLMNLGNGIDALCGGGARGGDLYRMLRAEAVDVLKAAKVDFVDRDEDRERRGNIMTIRPIGEAMRGGGSTWQSMARGLPSVETDYLNGEIVVLGRLQGVPTPANAFMQQVMRTAVRDGVQPGSVSPENLLQQLEAAG
ncbi:MAG: 2-dehydropantoate 2-reductase N-terminal domain-containing protein [Actinomycetota bacterium]